MFVIIIHRYRSKPEWWIGSPTAICYVVVDDRQQQNAICKRLCCIAWRNHICVLIELVPYTECVACLQRCAAGVYAFCISLFVSLSIARRMNDTIVTVWCVFGRSRDQSMLLFFCDKNRFADGRWWLLYFIYDRRRDERHTMLEKRSICLFGCGLIDAHQMILQQT